MNDTKLIKEAIRHINEVLKSNCDRACKHDHINLKMWLNELLECRERICKNCLFYKDNICCNGDSYLRAEPVDEDFGCVLFERRENERN